MKIKELKNLTAEELQAKGKDFRQEYFNLRMRQTSGQLEKPSRLRDLRKGIARVETLLSQKRNATAAAEAKKAA
jgi:large subunit ribosomal protein L29